MASPTLQPILVDEKIYYIDFTQDFPEAVSLHLKASSSPFLVIDRALPPSSFTSQKEWEIFVQKLKQRFETLNTHTTLIDTKRFADRLPEQIQKTLLEKERKNDFPPAYARSTVAQGVERDDGPNRTYNSQYARSYASAYGVRPESIHLFSFSMTLQSPCTRETKQKDQYRLILLDTQGNITSNNFLCKEDVRETPSEVPGIAIAFLKKEESNWKKALEVLSKNHSDLHPENLELFYTFLIYQELALLDETDLIQDAAASVYSSVPISRRETLQRNFPKATLITAGFNSIGSLGWGCESRRRNIPISTQAIGPLQIIPGFALAAYQYNDHEIFNSYSKILSPEDFRDERTVIRASFDPEKMFAIKAMLWDLQLRSLKKHPAGLTLNVTLLPHFTNPEGVRELSFLFGAFHLVHFPENRSEPYSDTSLNGAYSYPYLSILGIWGTQLGIMPKFAGIQYLTLNSRTCPSETLSSFQIDEQPICILKEEAFETWKEQRAPIDLSFPFRVERKEIRGISPLDFEVREELSSARQKFVALTKIQMTPETKRYSLELTLYRSSQAGEPLYQIAQVTSDPLKTRQKLLTETLKKILEKS